ncbi:hypothetical protein MSG28_014011 [Choristoneura fumiferana]|uniref:Uncharacterized protein n=1 Tax=Choristoneura fumiferana TaxID=7141 RepID=A0ACC0JFN0_CHOFU|nr:hypothetical protein MSG28_014011 [Choristoneura fumiferana]
MQHLLNNRVGRELRQLVVVLRRQAGQRAQEVRQEGQPERGEVHRRHRVRRRQRLVTEQRARAALAQPRQQDRQELAQELRAENRLQPQMFLVNSPLLDIGLFHGAPQHSVFSPSHPSAASDPLKVVHPPCFRTPYTTFPRPWSPFEDSSTPPFIGPATDVASPTPLQRTNSLSNNRHEVFIKALSPVGRRFWDPRAGAYLSQRISLAIQRGNAASVMGTLPQADLLDGAALHMRVTSMLISILAPKATTATHASGCTLCKLRSLKLPLHAVKLEIPTEATGGLSYGGCPTVDIVLVWRLRPVSVGQDDDGERLQVPVKYQQMFLCSDFWPEGVVFRRFRCASLLVDPAGKPNPIEAKRYFATGIPLTTLLQQRAHGAAARHAVTNSFTDLELHDKKISTGNDSFTDHGFHDKHIKVEGFIWGVATKCASLLVDPAGKPNPIEAKRYFATGIPLTTLLQQRANGAAARHAVTNSFTDLELHDKKISTGNDSFTDHGFHDKHIKVEGFI